MANGGFGVVAVQMRLKRFKRKVVIIGHKPFYAGDAAGNITGCSINFDPVTGRDDYTLNYALKIDQFTQRLFNLIGRESRLFTNLNGCSFVREADDDYIHELEQSGIMI